MNIRITIMALGLIAFTSCHYRESKENFVVEPTQAQQKLLDAGWKNETPDEDMSEGNYSAIGHGGVSSLK